MSGADPVADLAGQLGSIASQLAQRGDIAQTEQPGLALYHLAGTLGCLAGPVTALCARAAEGADAATAAELTTIRERLRTAEKVVRTAQRTLTRKEEG